MVILYQATKLFIQGEEFAAYNSSQALKLKLNYNLIKPLHELNYVLGFRDRRRRWLWIIHRRTQ